MPAYQKKLKKVANIVRAAGGLLIFDEVQSGYAQARQFNRLKKVVRRHRTILGKLIREIQRKMSGVSDAIQTRFTLWLERAQRIVRQQ